MSDGDIRFSKHAIERMGERDVTPDEVFDILRNGVMVHQDRIGSPNVSTTRLGWITRRAAAQPVHVVTVIETDGTMLVVTVMLPNPALWDTTFTKKVK